MPLVVQGNLGNMYNLIIDEATGAQYTIPVSPATASTNDNSITTPVLDLITSSLRLINVVAAGEPVPLDMANDALATLNDMLDNWNAQELGVFTTRVDDYAFVVGKQSYTIGSGGDFNTDRPARIDAMSSILIVNNANNPVEVPITMYSVTDWQQRMPVKNVSGSFPQVCYDDGAFPLRTLNFWPIPGQANSLRLYTWQPLTLQANLSTGINLPQGYSQAIKFNLAVLLAPEYAAPVSDIVARTAVQSFGVVKTMNAPDVKLRSDIVADDGGYSYKADMFGIPW